MKNKKDTPEIEVVKGSLPYAHRISGHVHTKIIYHCLQYPAQAIVLRAVHIVDTPMVYYYELFYVYKVNAEAYQSTGFQYFRNDADSLHAAKLALHRRANHPNPTVPLKHIGFLSREECCPGIGMDKLPIVKLSHGFPKRVRKPKPQVFQLKSPSIIVKDNLPPPIKLSWMSRAKSAFNGLCRVFTLRERVSK